MPIIVEITVFRCIASNLEIVNMMECSLPAVVWKVGRWTTLPAVSTSMLRDEL